jgi:hypothetical protein
MVGQRGTEKQVKADAEIKTVVSIRATALDFSDSWLELLFYLAEEFLQRAGSG